MGWVPLRILVTFGAVLAACTSEEKLYPRATVWPLPDAGPVDADGPPTLPAVVDPPVQTTMDGWRSARGPARVTAVGAGWIGDQASPDVLALVVVALDGRWTYTTAPQRTLGPGWEPEFVELPVAPLRIPIGTPPHVIRTPSGAAVVWLFEPEAPILAQVGGALADGGLLEEEAGGIDGGPAPRARSGRIVASIRIGMDGKVVAAPVRSTTTLDERLRVGASDRHIAVAGTRDKVEVLELVSDDGSVLSRDLPAPALGAPVWDGAAFALFGKRSSIPHDLVRVTAEGVVTWATIAEEDALDRPVFFGGSLWATRRSVIGTALARIDPTTGQVSTDPRTLPPDSELVVGSSGAWVDFFEEGCTDCPRAQRCPLGPEGLLRDRCVPAPDFGGGPGGGSSAWLTMALMGDDRMLELSAAKATLRMEVWSRGESLAQLVPFEPAIELRPRALSCQDVDHCRVLVERQHPIDPDSWQVLRTDGASRELLEEEPRHLAERVSWVEPTATGWSALATGSDEVSWLTLEADGRPSSSTPLPRWASDGDPWRTFVEPGQRRVFFGQDHAGRSLYGAATDREPKVVGAGFLDVARCFERYVGLRGGGRHRLQILQFEPATDPGFRPWMDVDDPSPGQRVEWSAIACRADLLVVAHSTEDTIRFVRVSLDGRRLPDLRWASCSGSLAAPERLAAASEQGAADRCASQRMLVSSGRRIFYVERSLDGLTFVEVGSGDHLRPARIAVPLEFGALSFPAWSEVGHETVFAVQSSGPRRDLWLGHVDVPMEGP